MLKGVNRQVLEINEPGCDYFERILFFVRPEFSGLGEARLREKAKSAVSGTVRPPVTRREKRKNRRKEILFALLGAGITSLVWGILSLFF